MDLGIARRGALVTGASRGIGRATALMLAAEGARVAICARTAGDVDAVVAECGGPERGHRGFVLDLAAEDAPAALAGRLAAEFGDVDILVHNLGGTLGVNDPLAPPALWRDVFRLNLEVAIELNGILIPAMAERAWGRVVSVLSLGAREHSGTIAYGTAKAALGAYTRGLARNVGRDGVVVTAVTPGAVLTDDGHWANQTRTNPARVEAYLASETIRGRFIEPREVAGAIVFLCSEFASACGGTFIGVDAGAGRSFEAP
jgi:3-oxoacyl-[acyl-carrier protein] reductase